MRTISDTILVLRARQFVLAYLLARQKINKLAQPQSWAFLFYGLHVAMV